MTDRERVLVTGATGFIGRHLCDELAKGAWSVRGTTRSARSDMRAEPVVIPKIDGATDWSAALAGVSTVVHLAAETSARSNADEASLMETNVAGTERLARAAAQAGVERMVFMSSVKVNGEVTRGIPFRASDPPAPADAYGRSKARAEESLRAVARDSALKLVILRPPLVYGPGVAGNFLRLVQLVDKRLPLPLAGVRNVRSLVGVRNLVHLVRHCLDTSATVGGTFLVSDGVDLSTPNLIRLIARHLGQPARLFHMPPMLLSGIGRLTGKSEMVERLIGSLAVDIGPTREQLGWQPAVSIDEGIAETVRWYRTAQKP